MLTASLNPSRYRFPIQPPQPFAFCAVPGNRHRGTILIVDFFCVQHG
jgi:hypothetical protein